MSTSARAIRPRKKGLRRIWDVQSARYLVQIGFASFIGWVFYNHATVGEGGAVITASPEAYCPLGGFESLYKYITTGGQFVAHTHLSNMVLFIGLAITAVVAKSYFCGWICPFGALQQLITGARRWVEGRIPALRALSRSLSARAERFAFLDRWLLWGKYLLLAWIIYGTVRFGIMVFRDIDPWAALLNILEADKGIGFAVLILTVVAAVFGDRVWCRYACPLGAIVGLIGKVSPIKVQRDSTACIGCNLCTKKCPMDIKVHEVSRVTAVECNMCLSCVSACPAPGALELRAAVPGLGQTQPVVQEAI